MTTNSSDRPPCVPRRRFAAVAVAMLALFAGTGLAGTGLAGIGLSALLAADAKSPSTVHLVIDYGDGVETHFTALKWASGMTVLDALVAAKAHKRGLAFEHRGSADTAMITKIGDLKNEGNGKNWLYSVNGKAGEVSAGIQAIKAGDVVLWKFQTYDYNQ